MKKFCALAALAASAVSGGPAAAQTVLQRVEEDWELHVTQPDESLDAPQVTTSMLPFGEGDEVLLQFDLNHATSPGFEPGGMQLRVCEGDDCVAQRRLSEFERLGRESETVSWTQVVQRTDGGYAFGVEGGRSESWGEFGGEAVHGSGGGSLNDYQPRYSLQNSRVTYAGNRVASLRLLRVRVYNQEGEVREIELNWDAPGAGAEVFTQ